MSRPKFCPPSHGAVAPSGPVPPGFRGFTTTFRHTTRGKDSSGPVIGLTQSLYLTMHNSHKRDMHVQQASESRPTL